jgi:hypothetical protein
MNKLVLGIMDGKSHGYEEGKKKKIEATEN